MFNLELFPPIRLFGQTVRYLDDAAYLIRQHAIRDNDSDARLFVRKLRDTEDLGSALRCEAELRQRSTKQAWRKVVALCSTLEKHAG
ncbi:MAG: hypothetical protein K2X60_09540 [Xanthobacteraceae bacterium]|nr:hypothetical protein [Xanthobacteraceae bacterium]